MILLFVITILLLIMQIAFALIAWNARENIKKRYAKPISSLLTPEKILNSNEKRFSKVIVKIHPKLEDVALAQSGILFIRKGDLTKNTLYINYKMFYHFYLAFNENRALRDFKTYQNIAFLFQIFFLILAAVFNQLIFNTFLIATLLFQIFCLLYSFYNLIMLSAYTKEVYRKSKKILELDNVEEARLEALMNDITLETFEYPFQLTLRVVQFFKL